jgi:predicted metal-dependent peptidase
MSSELDTRLKKARLDLVLDVPFFGTLAFKLKMEADPAVKTSVTDGKRFGINPDYAATLTQAQLAGLLVESIGHCAMGHLWRKGTRDGSRWEKACDQVIWETIHGLQNATDGRITLPPSGKVDPSYVQLSAEEVYHRMREGDDQGKGKGKGKGGGEGGGGGGSDYQSPGSMAPPDGGEGQGDGDQDGDGQGNGGAPGSGRSRQEAAKEIEEDWKQAVAQAATVERQKNQGNLPAWMKQLVEELVEPKVPWHEHVREFCHRISREDYSFRRPNRRHLGRGFVLPSLQSERLGPMVGAFDTSGSIFCHPKLVQALLSELQGVLDICRPEAMHLISCDTQVHQNVEFVPGDNLLAFVPQGGGGTDFRPVFREIEKLPEPPACVIFLTDLWGDFPEVAPDYPVLWANYGDKNGKAPFGTTIFVPIDT